MRINTLLIVTSILAGCATQNASKLITTNDLHEKGLVIVSLTQSGTPGGDMSSSAYYESADGRVKGHISTNAARLPLGLYKGDFKNTQGELSYFELPQGLYKFTGWSYAAGSVVIRSKEMNPYYFEIKQGETIYIGDIHVNAVMGNNIFGMPIASSGSISINDSSERDLNLFSSLVPGIDKGNIKTRVMEAKENTGSQDRQIIPMLFK